MNNCKYCNKEIPDKTVRGHPRTFCNKSCSRRYYIKNNPKKMKESALKSWESKYQSLRENPNYLKDSWVMTEKRKSTYELFIKNGHMSKMGKLGAEAMVKKYGDNFIREKERVTKVSNGKWLDYSKFDYQEFKRYNSAVRKLTRKVYGSAGNGYHWDHIVPVSKGYILKIPPSVLCSEENIRKIKAEDNLSKGNNLTKGAISILESWGITADDLF